MLGLSCRQRRQKRNSFDSTLVIQTFEAEAEIYSNSSLSNLKPSKIMPPIKLQTKDNVIMMVDEPAIVNYMINRRDPTPDGIFISDFRSEILFKVIKYIQFHAQSNSPGDMEVFDKEFVNEEQTVLFEIFVTAFVFKIKGLRDLTRLSFPSVAAAVELSALGVSDRRNIALRVTLALLLTSKATLALLLASSATLARDLGSVSFFVPKNVHM
ncbi:hypothetical protein OROMI_033495 [Orobanche minor]